MNRLSNKGVVYYAFGHFDKTGIVRHGFSTRLGGVSGGCYNAMNLGFTRGDDDNNVMRNYEAFCGALGIDVKNIVLSAQTHTTNVIKAGKSDRGNGILFKNTYKDVDGLITDEADTALVTLYADCVPIFLLDPVRRAIGLAHAGWKGTLEKIAECAVSLMKTEFGSDASNILAGIGPSIGPCCFETDEAVYTLFEEKDYAENFVSEKGGGKKNIDLWEVNRQVLINAGVLPENIETAGICTKCNPDIFYSHRKHGSERGSLAAIMELK